jgi:nucleoside-diphosphate-sugar epimerase
LKTLLTGASGFLGKSILNHFDRNTIVTIGRNNSSDLVQDISVPFKLNTSFNLVVHCAGKAHSIPRNEIEENEFFEINEKGTNNLLESLNENLPRRIVFISTVAVYGDSAKNLIDESSELLGNTPYALSKINSEKLIKEWSVKNDVDYLILRLPLICGENPPGNLEAMANAIKRGFYFRIGKGEARKSMVGADDVAQLIYKNKWKSGTYNLTDGIHPSIKDTDQIIASFFGKGIKRMPFFMAKAISLVGDYLPKFPLDSKRLKKLNSSLVFSDQLARKRLGWQPKSALDQLKFAKND